MKMIQPQIAPIRDGLPVGSIRSPKGYGDEILKPEQWCKGAPETSPFHKWSNTMDKFCVICGLDKETK